MDNYECFYTLLFGKSHHQSSAEHALNGIALVPIKNTKNNRIGEREERSTFNEIKIKITFWNEKHFGSFTGHSISLFLCSLKLLPYETDTHATCLKSLSPIYFVKVQLPDYLCNEFVIRMYTLLQIYTFEICTLSKITNTCKYNIFYW